MGKNFEFKSEANPKAALESGEAEASKGSAEVANCSVLKVTVEFVSFTDLN